MALETTLPWSKKGTTEDLIFTILTKEYPLRLIDLMNHIRKRYGKGVTFQAVRKAALQLCEKGVLIEENNRYAINKEWILESKRILDELYQELSQEKRSKNAESIAGDVSVYTFDSINNMMKFWQNLIDDWYNHFKKGDYPYNYYQAAHTWEGLLHPDTEQKVMQQLKKKGIQSFTLTTGTTPLDKQLSTFYKKLGIKVHSSPSLSSFDKSYYVGTYGNLVVQTQYPKIIVDLLDAFFKKNRSLKNLDFTELSNIVNKKVSCKLTVIKDLNMAKQINKSIKDQIA